MKIDGNQIKVGNILQINSKLWRVTKTQHTQPGKGGAYIQVEMKAIKEGTKANERFRSSENVERVILDEKKYQYLYSNENKFYFMDTTNYEQIEIGEDIINEDQSKFLVENQEILLQLYDSIPVSIILPEHVNLKVIEADAVVKGQTAASSYKPAILEKGIKTSVPPFIEVGDVVVVSTTDSAYIEKSKS